MRRLVAAIAVLLGCSASLRGAAPPTSLRAIELLTNADASRALPVSFVATVTYYRDYEKTLFVQDGAGAIYVQATTKQHLVPGDVVRVTGTTHESFRPVVFSSDIAVLRHGPLPRAIPATFDQLIRAELDCKRVSIRAVVRAADLVENSAGNTVNLQMLMDGGTLEATVDSSDGSQLPRLLDSEIELTGVSAGRFDGKMQQTGSLIHVTSFADIKVIRSGNGAGAALPVTPMDRIMMGYHVSVHSQRLKVHGTITYYQPGSAVVLQDGSRSLWIQTHSAARLTIGDQADVTGFPGLHDGFLTLTNGAIEDSHVYDPVAPQPSAWSRLVSSANIFDLVSIEGEVVASFRETAQDEFVLRTEGHVLSAIYHHPPPTKFSPVQLPPMRNFQPGARIRVTGICMLDDSNPFNNQVPISILLRSHDDISVVAGPPLLSVRNLILLVGLLLLSAICLGLWGWAADFRMRRHNASAAYMERRRAQILEDISGVRPLAEILEQITELVSFRLRGSPCWCQAGDGAPLGNRPAKTHLLRVEEREINARTGAAIGRLFAAFDRGSKRKPEEDEAMAMAAGLATLAIETRQLYSDLRHRSEFDRLTGLHNRFSMETKLGEQIESARKSAGVFGLIYVDLDRFKQINDLHGHKAGDVYLQQVAARMTAQLRSVDTLARIGGDEFAALLPMVRGRADVEEIAQRLEHCFDREFEIEHRLFRGSASIGFALYPEDGRTGDSLLHTADTAMYARKHVRRKPISIAAGSRT